MIVATFIIIFNFSAHCNFISPLQHLVVSGISVLLSLLSGGESQELEGLEMTEVPSEEKFTFKAKISNRIV